MNDKYIVYYPYDGKNAYIKNMKRCWGRIYKVIPLSCAENNIYVLRHTKAIVLNWVEGGFLDSGKKRQLFLYKRLGIKIIWVFHNRIPHACIDDADNEAKARKDMRFLAGISSAILLHSRHSRIYAEEYTNTLSKIFYVPHVDYTRQYRWTDERVNDENQEFTFVFQGAIAPYKNIELLIRVFKDLDMERCRLHIAGKPCNREYGERIEKLCRDSRIRIRLEYLLEYDVGEELRRGDVVVLPYDLRSSMNSGAMLNAFTNKRTVIVSNNAMAQDYENEDFLYIYGYKDEEEHYQHLKAAMRQAYLNGKSDNRKKGERAYQYTRMHNDDNAVVQRLSEILKSI